MGVKLIIPNADFSEHGLGISIAQGTPGATILIASYGNYSVTLGEDGFAEISNLLIPQTGVFGNAENQNRGDLTKLTPLFWDMSGVTSIHCLFNPFRNLVELDLSHLKNTGGITNMYRAFCDTKLAEIDLSHIDIHSVTSIEQAFGFGGAYNDSLKKINLGNSAITLSNTINCFMHLRVLEEIDAHNVDFTGISSANYSGMFTNCPLLTKVIAKDSANANWLIARLADAGYTFVSDGNYILTKVS